MGLLKQTLGRRALFVLGVVSVLSGLALLAFAFYSSAGDDGSGVEPLTVVDLEGKEVDLGIPELAPPPPAQPAPPPFGGSGFQLIIDKLGVSAPISTLGLDEQLVPEVPQTATDVAWYDFSARPGTGSNAVFAGHVTWNGRAVFYDLDQLQAGDQIRLVDDDGAQFTYNVSSVFQVDPGDPDSLKVMWPTEGDVITLITCSGEFYETDDPVAGGDYTHRLVVRAHLIAIDRPAAAGG